MLYCLYQQNSNIEKAHFYALKSCEYDQERIEGVIFSIEMFFKNENHIIINSLYHKYKNYHDYSINNKLFVFYDKYNYVLEYYNSISAYYVNDYESGYICSKILLEKETISFSIKKQICYNLYFYVNQLLLDNDKEKIFCSIKILFNKDEIKNIFINLYRHNNNIYYILYEIALKSSCKNEAINYLIICSVCQEDNMEPIYHLIKIYRETNKFAEAFLYYQKAMNQKDNKYYYKILYEYTIIAYYVGIKNINAELLEIMNHTNNVEEINNLLSNMKFYKNILIKQDTIMFDSTFTDIIYNIEHTFTSSSSCLIKQEKGYLLNVRFVNIKIINNNQYSHIYSPITYNKCLKLDEKFQLVEEKLYKTEIIEKKRMIGIEDMKIFEFNNKIIYIGTIFNKQKNKIMMVNGFYDNIQEKEIIPNFCYNECEKNWVYFKKNEQLFVIYKWFPLTICQINNNNELYLIEEKKMPLFFSRFRGSSNGFEYENEIWFITHIVSYEVPRHYYHVISIFNNNMELLKYTYPFKFEDEAIEYCLSIVVEKESVLINYSCWDRCTRIGIYNKKYIESLFIDSNH